MKHSRHPSGRPRLLAVFAAVLAAVSLQAAAGPRTVINAGHGGDTTGDLLARVGRDVLARRPDVVVLLVGTNDVLNSQKARSLPEYEEGLRTLAARISRSGARLLLVTIPAAHGPYLLKRHPAAFFGGATPRQKVDAANGVIRRVAAEAPFPLVDFFAALENAGGASAEPGSLIRNAANSGSEDGVHPTAAGYRLLARLVAEALVRARLQEARMIVCFGDSLTFGVHMAGEGTATGETYPAFLGQALQENPEQSP